MRFLNYILLLTFGALLVYASVGLPNHGDADAPAHREVSPAGTPGAAAYYIRNAERDANTPNMVTVVLADYRSYDTLGEVIVIFTAGMTCYLVLRRRKQ